MRPWGELSAAAGERARAAARLVEGVVHAAGDGIADVVETAGHAIEGGLCAAGERAGRLPAAGGALRAIAAWSGGIVAGIARLVGAAVKGGFGVVAGALGGALEVGCGVLLLQRALVLGGLVDLGAGVAGLVLLVVGKLVSLVQHALFLQRRARPLTAEEKAMLRRVFRRSLSLYNVRLVEGRAGVFGLSDRPFTLGNTIYLKQYLSTVPGLLVHECVHAWQYQSIGPRYAVDALGAQQLLPDAYDWEGELKRGRAAWTVFNKEAQAQLIEDTWLGGSLTAEGRTTTGGGCFFDIGGDGATVVFSYQGTDHTALAVGAATSLRKRLNARWSKLL